MSSLGLSGECPFFFCQISLVKSMQQLLKKFSLWTVMNHAIQLRVFESSMVYSKLIYGNIFYKTNWVVFEVQFIKIVIQFFSCLMISTGF
jgi:hypothetical protein